MKRVEPHTHKKLNKQKEGGGGGRGAFCERKGVGGGINPVVTEHFYKNKTLVMEDPTWWKKRTEQWEV